MDSIQYDMMKWCIDKTGKKSGKVLDVGSMDVNGSHKPVFQDPAWSAGWTYTGIDIEPGNNVDLVVPPYAWPLPDNHYDLVISGSCLEHVEDMHRWADEVIRVTKKHGCICVVVPSLWHEHKFPVDCWRVYPDGMRWLFVNRTRQTKEVWCANYKGPDIYEYCYGVFVKL